MKIAVIGAGAAGCFCAAEIARSCPSAEVTVYEGGAKALAKVAITGGGRCNLTNDFDGITDLRGVYPRGHRLMKRLLHEFGTEDTMKWFSDNGVRLAVQSDHRVFPVSQDAMEIVRTLLRLMSENGVRLRLGCKVDSIRPGYVIDFTDGSSVPADLVIVTTGGLSRGGANILRELDVKLEDPVPSLFALEIKDDFLRRCSGCSVDNVSVSIIGSPFKAKGAVLVTDWGLSGPAILKLSSYAARFLAENRYECELGINWGLSGYAATRDELVSWLEKTSETHAQRQLLSTHPDGIPSRLWEHILGRCAFRPDLRWCEIGAKGLNRLTERLLLDNYLVSGKNKFKGEFVTCGGVAISEVSPQTLESKDWPGLYFAGEVLDIDGITGGFNLQAAWTTAHTVGGAIIKRYGYN